MLATIAASFCVGAQTHEEPGRIEPPTRAQILADDYLRNALSRSAEGLQVVRHANGTLSVDLQGRFRAITAARLDAAGRVQTICTGSHETLADFLAAHPGSLPPGRPPSGLDD